MSNFIQQHIELFIGMAIPCISFGIYAFLVTSLKDKESIFNSIFESIKAIVILYAIAILTYALLYGLYCMLK